MKINKIFLGLFLSTAVLTSCDMNTTNYGVLDQGSAIQSVDDAEQFLNGIYIQMRTKGAGTYIALPDLQADYFVGIVDNGNRNGSYSRGQVLVSDQDWTDNFYNLYNLINAINYFDPHITSLIESGDYEGDELTTLKYYKGSAKFMRAYAYWYLFDKLVWYNKADLEAEGKGLQIVKTYNPTGNRADYVGRSTINETVQYIADELNEAYTLIADYEKNVSKQYAGPNSARVNSYVVLALQARMALLTEDYQTAYNKATEVINSGVFALAEGDDYYDMWITDSSDELMFVPFAEVGNGGISTGTIYYTNNKEENADYIPTLDWIFAYDMDDIRFDSFFTIYSPLKVNGENYLSYIFNKYPGNPELRTSASTNNNLNKAKPFRLSEMYLIAAEATTFEGPAKSEANANKYLNELRAARIDGYEDETLAGDVLIQAIREERGKELIGEGFRFSDLRRWGQGFIRTAGYEELAGTSMAILADLMDVISPNTNNVSYLPDDYRFVWPIPFREMQVNPQLKGQQNPRY